MFCKKCGNELSPNAVFCPECGEKISEEISESLKIEPSKKIDNSNISKYKGLSGWLTIVLLGLIITGLYNAYNFFDTLNSLNGGDFAVYANRTSQYYNPDLLFLIKSEMMVSLVIAVSSAYLIYIFSKAKKSFPKLVSIFWVITALWILFDTFYAQSIANIPVDTLEEANTEAGRTFVYAIIWVSYMAKSKRVKATFVND